MNQNLDTPQKLIHTKLTGVEKLVVFSLHSTMINYLFLTMNLYNIITDFSYWLVLQLLSDQSLKAETFW